MISELKGKISSNKKPALLIFIAPENKCRSICNNVYERNIIEDGIQLGYLSWEKILEEMKKINLESELDNYQRLIINDIILLLKRKGLEKFKNFKLQCKDIDCQLWFRFDDKIYKDIEFNYNKTIQGESYYEFR